MRPPVCTRYTLTDSRQLASRFDLPELAALPMRPVSPRYNLAPLNGVPAITHTGERRMLLAMRWGFQPPWVRDEPGRPPPINARAETLADNGLFQRAVRFQRCLIPADGYYDWTLIPGEERRRPLHIRLEGGGLFAFAGLFTGFRDRLDEFATCAIVTTTANALLAPFGARMPAILRPEDEARWLDPRVRQSGAVLPLLRPYPVEAMTLRLASRLVNSPFNDGPELLDPAREPDEDVEEPGRA
jgi:putative SOS response-associated peptidase YedK